jgi:hypothetical protein
MHTLIERLIAGGFHRSQPVRQDSAENIDHLAIAIIAAAQLAADMFKAVKGVTAPVLLSFDLKIAGDRAEVSGKATLDRSVFRIGMESDPKAEWVAKTIEIDCRQPGRTGILRQKRKFGS